MRLVGLILGFLLLFVGITPVFACTQMPNYTPPSLEAIMQNTPVILLGTIVEGAGTLFEDRGSPMLVQAEVEVELYLKGGGSARVEIAGFERSTCEPEAYVGLRAIFFVGGNPDELHVLDFYFVTDELIEDIVSISNQSFAPEGVASATASATNTSRPSATASRTSTVTESPSKTPNATDTIAPSATVTATEHPSTTDTPSSTATAEAVVETPVTEANDNSSWILYSGIALIGAGILAFVFLMTRKRSA